MSFIARGKRKAPDGDDRSEGPKGKGRRAQQRIFKKESYSDLDARAAGNNDKGAGKGGKGNDHPRKNKKGFYITTREGAEICFRFAAGNRDACTTPCAQGRAHVCQKCLQPHRNNSEACAVAA